MTIGIYVARALVQGPGGDPGNGRPVRGFKGPYFYRLPKAAKMVPGKFALAGLVRGALTNAGVRQYVPLVRVLAAGREGFRNVVHVG